MAISKSHRGFRQDHKAKTLDITFDGETATGFASFETVYANPTAIQMAPLGHGVTDPMGGKWRYCKAGAAITNGLFGLGAYAQPTDVTAAIAAVGDRTLDYTGSSDATCTADQYASGAIVIGGSAIGSRRFYHIKGNTVSATTTGTLSLHHPIKVVLAGTEWATINPSPWADVRPMSDGLTSACCMSFQSVTSGYYFWGKTRGHAYGVVNSTVPGAASNDRLIIFMTDGSMAMADEAWNAGNSKQICGWLMPRTGGAYGGGDQSVWLQLE